MQNYEIDFQLAPPHMNRRNAVERAIITLQKPLHSSIIKNRSRFTNQKMGPATLSMLDHLEPHLKLQG